MMRAKRPLLLLGLLSTVLRCTSVSIIPSARSFSSSGSLPRLRVLLIRHGESFNNALSEVSVSHYRNNRLADPHLTPLGELQAAAVASHLSGPDCLPLLAGLSAVYVSPFLRTLQTATPLVLSLSSSSANPLVSRGKIWRDLFEVGGAFHRHEHAGGAVGTGGLPLEEMLSRFPVEYCPRFHEGTPGKGVDSKGWYDGHTRETVEEAKARVKRVAARLRCMAKELEKDGGSKTIALVVHGDFIDIILQEFLQLDLSMLGDQSKHVFRTYNTCFTCVDIFQDDKVAILFHNYHQHLKDLVKIEKLGIV